MCQILLCTWSELFDSINLIKLIWLYISGLKKHKILQKLRSQNDIKIKHPDKGNGIAILNRSDYIKSMTKLISDKKKN